MAITDQSLDEAQARCHVGSRGVAGSRGRGLDQAEPSSSTESTSSRPADAVSSCSGGIIYKKAHSKLPSDEAHSLQCVL
nr:uncharacterized protein LOC100663619 [Loxodonta africana]